MKSYILKISLKDSDPLIWREVMVPKRISFNKLHHIIQVAMGWGDYSAYEFCFSEEHLFITNSIDEVAEFEEDSSIGIEQSFKHSSLIKIDEYVKKYPKIKYIYDLGADWEHEIELLREVKDITKSPTLIDGEGERPLEDFDDLSGYEEFYEPIRKYLDPEYKEIKAWAEGASFKKLSPL